MNSNDPNTPDQPDLFGAGTEQSTDSANLTDGATVEGAAESTAAVEGGTQTEGNPSPDDGDTPDGADQPDDGDTPDTDDEPTAVAPEEEPNPLDPFTVIPETPLTTEEVVDAVQEQIDALPTATRDTESAKAWLRDFRAPVAAIGTQAFVDLIRAHTERRSDDYLRALYRELSPEELNAVAEANADTIEKLATAAEQQAALMTAARERLSVTVSSFIYSGLSKVLLLV